MTGVQWANTYLKKARLLQSTGRGRFKITPRGLESLNADLDTIDRAYLKQFPEFVEFITPSPGKNDYLVESVETPRVLIHSMYQNLLVDLSEELLDYVLSSSPEFFEKLVIDLLLAMGYGGSLENVGQNIGKSGDGGIDGYIQGGQAWPGYDLCTGQALGTR